jgi:hypothetical protein
MAQRLGGVPEPRQARGIRHRRCGLLMEMGSAAGSDHDPRLTASGG